MVKSMNAAVNGQSKVSVVSGALVPHPQAEGPTPAAPPLASPLSLHQTAGLQSPVPCHLFCWEPACLYSADAITLEVSSLAVGSLGGSLALIQHCKDGR